MASAVSVGLAARSTARAPATWGAAWEVPPTGRAAGVDEGARGQHGEEGGGVGEAGHLVGRGGRVGAGGPAEAADVGVVDRPDRDGRRRRRPARRGRWCSRCCRRRPRSRMPAVRAAWIGAAKASVGQAAVKAPPPRLMLMATMLRAARLATAQLMAGDDVRAVGVAVGAEDVEHGELGPGRHAGHDGRDVGPVPLVVEGAVVRREVGGVAHLAGGRDAGRGAAPEGRGLVVHPGVEDHHGGARAGLAGGGGDRLADERERLEPGRARGAGRRARAPPRRGPGAAPGPPGWRAEVEGREVVVAVEDQGLAGRQVLPRPPPSSRRRPRRGARPRPDRPRRRRGVPGLDAVRRTAMARPRAGCGTGRSSSSTRTSTAGRRRPPPRSPRAAAPRVADRSARRGAHRRRSRGGRPAPRRALPTTSSRTWTCDVTLSPCSPSECTGEARIDGPDIGRAAGGCPGVGPTWEAPPTHRAGPGPRAGDSESGKVDPGGRAGRRGGSAPRLAPGLGGAERGHDGAGRGGAVERVEVDARGAAPQEVLALEGGVGHAHLAGRLGVLAADLQAAWRRGGMVAPHIAVKRSTCSTFVKGMMPGTIGTATPAARARSTNRSKTRFSKKSWVTRKSAPASDLGLEVAQVLDEVPASPGGPPGRRPRRRRSPSASAARG